MNWSGSLLAGFAGTLVLTSLEAGAQQLNLTRMSVPYLLGAAVTKSRDRAKVVGFFTHLVNGQLFALLYVAIFNALGEGGVLRGAFIGLVHSAIVLLVVMPLLPSIHPRMASLHQGPTQLRQLEPPGPFALHYGVSTPVVVVLSHIVFGALVGALAPIH
ncbi:MAG TPA: hypothetical protein VI356_07100 [Myxococcales bacterium]